MTADDIKLSIEQKWPGSKAEVLDLTGTSDHFQVTVVSPAFEGQSMINQHRMVKSLFDPVIQSGELHALSLKTFTPNDWAKRGVKK